ncbi:hypothetical protein C0993_009633 [Termitomyces sp. T159_Od127]|nr:hypothetical protein C0993_009633 [Termitomyces sp. T159_Od127]
MQTRLNLGLRALVPGAPPVQKNSPCPNLTHPLTFYDGHLDRRLALKRVEFATTLLVDLSKSVNTILKKILEDHIELPPVEAFPTPRQYKTYVDPVPAKDARAIGLRYRAIVSNFVCDLASTLALYPTAPTWSPAIQLAVRITSRHQQYYPLNEEFVLEFRKPYGLDNREELPMVPQSAWRTLNAAEQARFREMSQRFPKTAVWQFYFVHKEAEDALKNLSRLFTMKTFPEITPLTLSEDRPTSDVPLVLSPDAISTAWGSPVTSWVSVTRSPRFDSVVQSHTLNILRRSTRPTKFRSKVYKQNKNPAKNVDEMKTLPSVSIAEENRRWPNVVIPAKKRDMAVLDNDMAVSILQHAWTQAVEKDSSFLVLNCGTFERIAFRHRSSQTLFVSDLVDVARYIRDRTHQVLLQEAGEKSIKSKCKYAPRQNNLRPRTRRSVALEELQKSESIRNFKAVCDNLASRKLALLRIQHGPYNSTAPSSFLRVNETKTAHKLEYEPHEYFRITIFSELAYGTTGDTHMARIELLGPDRKPLSLSNVVIKLAFGEIQKKRLRHEFHVYDHLMSTGSRGIPYVFGLFEDVETETLALIMENVGLSVWDCRLPNQSKRLQNTLSESEKSGFLDALKSIHSAGVRHRDLRVENLTISHEGHPYIIDFDRAALNASEDARVREQKNLMALLNGQYETSLSHETQEPDSDSDSDYNWRE